MKKSFVHSLGWVYRNILTRIFFLFDSEPIHEFFLDVGGVMAKIPGVIPFLRTLIRVSDPSLETSVAEMRFDNPIGLAAGFDYKAQLPPFLSALGFGYGSVGTLTNLPYEGNPAPRLGRLVKSRSLMVNKGFKNLGIAETLAKYRGVAFTVPVGVSIGRTNTLAHTRQSDAVEDICCAFQKAEESGVQFSYYELNISCPNLLSAIEFYSSERLRELLSSVFVIRLTRPLFIKMPIDRTNEEYRAMLQVIREFPVAGIIIGNLQKDRRHPALVPEEVAKYPKGNFSGAPCFDRSNELIALAYKETKGELPIIGCGGIFSAADAYKKIRLGASLVQCASGLVFMGPQFPAEICADLPALLRRDGFIHVRDAVGVDSK